MTTMKGAGGWRWPLSLTTALQVLSAVALLCVVAYSGRLGSGTDALAGHPLLSTLVYFEANSGQAAADVRYVLRQRWYDVLIYERDFAWSWRDAGTAIRLAPVGANRRSISKAEQPLLAGVSYGVASGPGTMVAETFARVRWAGIYPSIDLELRGEAEALVCEFVVGGGGDPGVIALDFMGASPVDITERGDLRLRSGERELVHGRPTAYQVVDGRRVDLDAGYALDPRGRVVFVLGRRQPGSPTTITVRIVE